MRLTAVAMATVLAAACGDSNEGAADVTSGLDGAERLDLRVSDLVALPDAMGPADSAAADAAAPSATVQVGTGQDAFEALTPGQRVTFILGPQSTGDRVRGYHVWGALRATGIDPDPVRATFTLRSADADSPLGEARARTLPLVGDGADGFVGLAYPVILEDCCPARNREMILRVEIEDAAGLTATSEQRVVGADACLGTDDRDICP